MHSQTGRIPRKLLHTAIVICLSVLCLASIEMASAKYKFQSHGNDSASVACFSPSLISENNIDISVIKKPGDSTEKTFKVQNFSGNSVSVVTMKYKIILKTTGNLPLTFTLLDGGENSVAVWNCDGTSGKQEYIFENNTLCFNAETSEHHDYKLQVEWQGEKNNARFSGMTDAVYLSVIWEQVD